MISIIIVFIVDIFISNYLGTNCSRMDLDQRSELFCLADFRPPGLFNTCPHRCNESGGGIWFVFSERCVTICDNVWHAALLILLVTCMEVPRAASYRALLWLVAVVVLKSPPEAHPATQRFTALHSPSQPLTSSANTPPTSEHTHTHLLSFSHEQSASISRPLFETSQGWNMECLLPEYSFLSGLNRWHPVTRLWEGNLCEVKTHARDMWYPLIFDT